MTFTWYSIKIVNPGFLKFVDNYTDRDISYVAELVFRQWKHDVSLSLSLSLSVSHITY